MLQAPLKECETSSQNQLHGLMIYLFKKRSVTAMAEMSLKFAFNFTW